MTDELLQFIHKVIRDNIRDIYRAQVDIATRRIYRQGRDERVIQGAGNVIRGRSGNLMNRLRNPSYMIDRGMTRLDARLDYPVYIRFLDMKRMGNYKIYNRQIWGILYSRAFPKIRYEWREDVRKWIMEELQAIEERKNSFKQT